MAKTKGAASKTFILPPNPSANAKIQKATANILPCTIHHDGPIDIHRRYWSPRKDDSDGALTAYFRGRKLRSRHINLPQGYSALLLAKSDKTKKDNSLIQQATAELEAKRTTLDPNEYLHEENAMRLAISNGDLKADDHHLLESEAHIDSIQLWGHDTVPEPNGPFERAISEWIAVAAAVSLVNFGRHL